VPGGRLRDRLGARGCRTGPLQAPAAAPASE
jgi:hypothetical protein